MNYYLKNANSGAYVNSLVVKSTKGVLYMITGYNSDSNDIYIQVHDASVIPADGVAPEVLFRVPSLSNFSLDLGANGRHFDNGIVICNSSTGATKTVGSAKCWFDAQYI